LSYADFGAIYTLGTLASAGAIVWTGSWIDRVDLRVYATLVCAAFVLAHFAMAIASGVVMLVVAVFLLRQAGQSLMVHTAQASMARYFDRNRGRAISLSALGLAGGEAIFPALAVLLISVFAWRGAWLATGTVLGLGLIPLILWLLRGHTERHQSHLSGRAAANADIPVSDWTRRRVVFDPSFYLLLLPYMTITFLVTGLFFHQSVVLSSKGWDPILIAQAFVVYSLIKVPTTLFYGHLIDRIGSRRMTPFFLFPMALAMLVLAVFDHRMSAYLYLGLVGLSAGGAMTLLGALWAEVYGVTHLGSIRSAAMLIWVAAGAASTWVLGIVFDAGISLERMAVAAFGFIVLASIAAGLGARITGRRLHAD
jgi:MFS family permease